MDRVYMILLAFFYILVHTESQEDLENHSTNSLILPEKYSLQIVSFFTNVSFRGIVSIDIQVLNLTNTIALKAKSLNISEVFIKSCSETKNISFNFISEDGQIIITATEDYFIGRYNLQIFFMGKMGDNKNEEGFYYNSYIDNETVLYFGVSKSEVSKGCRFFPCFDEPSLRAPFTIQIARFENQSSQSNMPRALTSSPDVSIDGRVWDTYYESPTMSPHQAGISVHHFSSFTNGSVTLLAAADVIDQGALALSLTPTAMDTLQQWLLGEPYSLPKVDIMALPDTRPEITNTPGLVMCGENQILFKEHISNTVDEQEVVKNVVNIVVQQMFTKPFINESWLAEGIFEYFKYKILSVMKPSWKIDGLFNVEILQEAFLDDFESGHSVEDTLLAKRVAAILKMTENYWSEYLMRKSFHQVVDFGGVVSMDQFLAAFKNESDFTNTLPSNWTLPTILGAWLSHPGYSIVTVTVDNNSLSVSQSKKEWPLLLTYTSGQEVGINQIWLTTAQETVNITLNDSTSWVVCNVNQQGFYRVHYNTKNWLLLSDQLIRNHTMLSPVTRSQLIDDAYQLAFSEQLDYSIAFNISHYLINEHDLIPWKAAFRNLDQLIRIFYETNISAKLQSFGQTLISPYFNRTYRINTVGEDHVDKVARQDVLFWACKWRLPACLDFTAALFSQWQSISTGFPADYKPSVLCTGVRQNPSTFMDVFDFFTDSDVDSDRKVFLSALACTQDYQNLFSLMSLAFLQDYNTIHQHEKVFLFNQIISKPENIQYVLTFISTFHNVMLNILGERLMSSIWMSLGRNVVLKTDVENLREMVQNLTLPYSLRVNLNITLVVAKHSQKISQRLAPLVIAAVTNFKPEVIANSHGNRILSIYSLNFLILVLFSLKLK